MYCLAFMFHIPFQFFRKFKYEVCIGMPNTLRHPNLNLIELLLCIKSNALDTLLNCGKKSANRS